MDTKEVSVLDSYADILSHIDKELGYFAFGNQVSYQTAYHEVPSASLNPQFLTPDLVRPGTFMLSKNNPFKRLLDRGTVNIFLSSLYIVKL